MEVWIFQSANRIALNDCGARDPRRRPYWVMKQQGEFPRAAQVDLDPADSKQFARIMKSREALYRLVDNADGYCTIDSDPGGWAKSPLADLMKIFKSSRTLLDRICVRGKQTKLIHWLWSGWGQPGWWTRTWRVADQEKFIRKTIRAMKTEVPEPWRLIAGKREYLPACAAENVLGKTIFLPYNVIEGEPSRPGTQIDLALQREHLDAALRYPGLAGLMGNVQTPLLQFPHVSYFLSAAWNHDQRTRSPKAGLRDLASRIYPDHCDLLADCWMALAAKVRGRAASLAGRLDRLVKGNRLGRPGVLESTLFPDRGQLARDLVTQLRERGAFDSLREATRREASKAECSRRVEAFLRAALSWDAQHGWSAYWKKLGRPWSLWPDHHPSFSAIVLALRKALGREAIDEFLTPIERRLARRHDAWIVRHCAVTPLRGAILKVS
jgi:hypothetical protein